MMTVPTQPDLRPKKCPVCGEMVDIANHQVALTHATQDEAHIERLLRPGIVQQFQQDTAESTDPKVVTETKDGQSIPQHHERGDG